MKNKVVIIVVLILCIAGLMLAKTIISDKLNIDVDNLENTENVETNIMRVDIDTFKDEVLNSDEKVLVDFYADWCPPCKMIAPLIEEVAEENENVKFVKIDIDANNDLASECRIVYIPTLVVFENGKEIDRAVGYIEKMEIEKLIK